MLKNGAAYLTYVMYLRKSRQDDPTETIEEVLAKHEAQLQEFAELYLGGRIPEENIYREVVSGESIDEREAIKEVLARMESNDVKGVLVMDAQRLSRGDLTDCGRLMQALQYTDTVVTTIDDEYDLTTKRDRKAFQDELLRGRAYLEYTKEILWRGRLAAVKRGCWISGRRPYGYARVKHGKCWTLEPIETEATVVRLMFDWAAKEGLTPGAIAKRLNEQGVPTMSGCPWGKHTIMQMLTNPVYIGKIRYNRIKETQAMENGERVKRRLKQSPEDILIFEGLHQGIVEPELYEAVQQHRAISATNPRSFGVKNVLAGLLRCSKCGRILDRRIKKGDADRYYCEDNKCYKSTKCDDVINAVIFALEQSELPALEAKLKNGDGDAANIQKRRLAGLVKELEGLRVQEDKQFELLETGVYTQALFDKRHAALREKIEAAEKLIYQTRALMPKNVDYKESIIKLEQAIRALKNEEGTIESRNLLLRAIIERIEITTGPVGSRSKDIKLDIFLRL